ncbi:MAG: DUF4738 domain-containing protein, partial [Prevotellaceae bacterium]|nr:DUF4738 domain-containing protein [Prevotellaceae bacterium]
MKYFVTLLLLVSVFAGCKQNIKKESVQEENKKAKALLEGIWKDSDEDNVAFLVKGDTIYYPDSTSQPVYFEIIDDTLVLKGNSISKYPIIRQEAHLFEFKNQSDDIVKFIKSEDPNDSLEFIRQSPNVLNQRIVIKRDTIISHSDKKYHCYVQINPTTYKVFRTSYNSEGIEVENVYYDNIIHISIFSGAN